MATAQGNMLGLVELADSDGLFDTYGAESFATMRDEFFRRMQRWARANDRWRLLERNRFCVVLRGVDGRAQLELAAAKLARLFEEPLSVFGRPVQLEVKAGFAALARPELEDELAMHQAGLALRSARRSPRLFELYSPDVEADHKDRRALLKSLERAVELGELQLYFQPKVHAGYLNVVGAEALMRWHSPERGVVQPDMFIPLAERNGVIRPMTWWAVKSAIARLARWPAALSIAVNIPPNLLLDDEIITVIRDSLAIHEVDPERLTLEVTESVMVDNQDRMLKQLARLRGMGLRVAIDDFGTGFSSLAYFRDLPADEIKIDKSFVLRMLESGRDHAIVKAVIDLAHNFSLKVVAEGVEDERTAKRLSDMRCDVLQGYAFDKPLRLEEFEKRYL